MYHKSRGYFVDSAVLNTRVYLVNIDLGRAVFVWYTPIKGRNHHYGHNTSCIRNYGRANIPIKSIANNIFNLVMATEVDLFN